MSVLSIYNANSVVFVRSLVLLVDFRSRAYIYARAYIFDNRITGTRRLYIHVAANDLFDFLSRSIFGRSSTDSCIDGSYEFDNMKGTDVYNLYYMFFKTRAYTHCNDPSAGSPTETLLRLLLPLNDQVWSSFHTHRRRRNAIACRSEDLTKSFNR